MHRYVAGMSERPRASRAEGLPQRDKVRTTVSFTVFGRTCRAAVFAWDTYPKRRLSPGHERWVAPRSRHPAVAHGAMHRRFGGVRELQAGVACHGLKKSGRPAGLLNSEESVGPRYSIGCPVLTDGWHPKRTLTDGWHPKPVLTDGWHPKRLNARWVAPKTPESEIVWQPVAVS